MFEQFSALFLKNIVLKRRSIIATIFELCLPFIVFLFFFEGILQFDTGFGVDENITPRDPTSSPTARLLIETICSSNTRHQEVIAFVPTESMTRIKNFLAQDAACDAENYLMGFKSKSALEKYMYSSKYRDENNKGIALAVVWNDYEGPQFEYTMRGNSSYYVGLPKPQSPLYDYVTPSRASSDDIDTFNKVGFTPLQRLVDIDTMYRSGVTSVDPFAMSIDDFDKVFPPQVTHTFPSLAYHTSFIAINISVIIRSMILIMFAFSLSKMVISITEEKELMIRSCLEMMGLTSVSLYFSWVVFYLALYTISSLLLAITMANCIDDLPFFDIFFLLFVFHIAWIAMSCMFTTFFTRAKVASWFVTIFSALIFLVTTAFATTSSLSLWASLFPLSALSMWVEDVLYLMQTGAEYDPENMRGFAIRHLSYTTTLAMLFIDAIIYFVLAVYFDKVLPSSTHTTLPWYFPFSPYYWRQLTGLQQEEDTSSFFSSPNSLLTDRVEQATPEMMEQIGVQIQNLDKSFTTDKVTVHAVNNLSLNMYKGQVMCLLGLNGSGKSTVINALTGVLSPSSGTAVVMGNDIRYDMAKIHRTIGICPQYNALYPNLTVLQHMYLYASIKGVERSVMDQEVHGILDRVGLGPAGDNKLSFETQALSGGQLRKLSVAIALLNSPQVIILDEPTSGMDVAAQRHIWSLVNDLKRDRVILLTTHSMEEAEICDNIAILKHGELQCAGSSLFLKNLYGIGYTLTATKGSNTPDINPRAYYNETTSAVGSHITQSLINKFSFVKLSSESGNEIMFKLPSANADQFPKLFDLLDELKGQNYIGTYGISITTLTDVFLKASDIETDDKALVGSSPDERFPSINQGLHDEFSVNQPLNINIDSSGDDTDVDMWSRDTNNISILGQTKALLIKRLHVFKRDIRFALWGILCPALIFGLTMYSIHTSLISTAHEVMSLQSLPHDTPLAYIARAAGVPASVKSIYEAFDEIKNGEVEEVNIESHLVTDIQTYLFHHTNEYESENPLYGLFDLSAANINNPTAAEPFLTGSMYLNSTLSCASPVFVNTLHNSVMKSVNEKFSIKMTYETLPDDSFVVTFAMTLVLALTLLMVLSFTPASVIAFVVAEREEKGKHLQIISGASPLAYWVANYTFDLCTCLFPFVTFMIVIVIGDLSTYLLVPLPHLALIIWLFYFASIPFAYCMSYLFKSPSKAQTAIFLFSMFIPYILFLTLIILLLVDVNVEYAIDFCCIIPAFAFAAILFTSAEGDNFTFNSFANRIIIYLFLDILLYSACLYLFEYWAVNHTWDKFTLGFTSADTYMESNPPTDSSVIEEAARIGRGECNPSEYPIVLNALRKVYPGPFVAVDKLSFAVKKASTFALLGSNGSGKTTTCKMLSSEILPSSTSGPAYLGGLNVIQHQDETRRLIGYCPQFDALQPFLTAREHLYLYARIKGVPEMFLEGFASSLIEQLGLEKYADRRVNTYSLGTKRRLSVGVALVGNPLIVFLDEPSTGVDPSSKRSMWRLINKTMANRSVILTSHSMEEVEALCDRIGIMAKGGLRCLGTSQELKSKFGYGYQVTVQTTTSQDQDVINVIKRRLHTAQVVEYYGCNLKMNIAKNEIGLGDLFTYLQSLKGTQIETYSISDTDLQQIFIQVTA